MPFDQFTLEVLAGDQLPGRTQEQQLASGFLRNNPHNGEGGRIAEELAPLVLRAQRRQAFKIGKECIDVVGGCGDVDRCRSGGGKISGAHGCILAELQASAPIRPSALLRIEHMASRFHHAHLFATDLETSLMFYERWFDAIVVADHEFAGARNVMVRVGTGMLNFYDQPPKDNGRNAIHHLGFQVDDLAGLVSRMREAGMELRSPIRELPTLDYIMIEAPDSVLLEVFEYKGSPDGATNGLDEWFS